MTEDLYLYPGTNVLRNKLEIRDQTALDRVERLALRATSSATSITYTPFAKVMAGRSSNISSSLRSRLDTGST